MVHSPMLTLGIFLCIANSLSFFAPWNSYISVMISPQQSAVSSQVILNLTLQGLQNQPEIPTKSRPEYLLSSSSEKSGETMREKRNSGEGQDYGGAGGGGGQQGQGGLTLSVTANFYALQQKLMRELWLRNSRVNN